MSEQLPSGVQPVGGGGDPPPPRGRLRSDYIVAAVLLVFCAVVYGLTFTFETVPTSLSQNMPPEFFPRLLLWAIAGLTIAMLIEGRSRPEKRRKPLPAMAYWTFGVLLGFLILAKLFGLTPTMVVLCVVLPVLWGERRFGVLAIYTIVFPLAVYALFTRVLEVRFPTGLVLRWFGYYINL